MKKILALALALCLVMGLVACGGNDTNETTKATEPNTTTAPVENQDNKPAPTEGTEISLWTYPVGKWGDQATVEKLMADFKAATGITVKVQFLSYKDGDDKINTAITAGQAPDLVLEGPERLVANWGAKGKMVDMSDMLDDQDKAEILPATLAACTSADGALYEYPLVMTAHCMGVNLTAFQAAGADQYLDLDTHTWTTENYFKAIEALNAKFPGQPVTAVFCGGQGGDQGTRALINNLYGGTFTNAEHTEYTWADEANVKAITKLYETEGVNFDAAIVGGDEIKLFYQGVLKIANCWNIQQQLDPNSAGTGAGKTVTGDEIVCMAFPTENGEPKLQGGIWGFGIFDNGDAAKIEAAKTFVKYFADSEHTVEAVKTSNFFPARTAAEGTDLSNVWADNETMQEYQILMPYLGDYYQVTKGWAQARTSWWTMLQKVGEGEDIAEAIDTYVAEANAAAQA